MYAEEVFYVEYYDIEIPRFFTPTGDGENDTWAPRNTQQYPNIHTLIFDRYGRLLKELSQGQSWDGTYNGKEMPTGDYWYIIPWVRNPMVENSKDTLLYTDNSYQLSVISCQFSITDN